MNVSTYLEFAEQHLTVSSNNGNEAAFHCPFHEDRNASASMNIINGKWKCFSCGQGGGIKSLARKLGVRFAGDTNVDQLGELWDKLERLDGKGRQTGVRTPKLPESTLARFDFPTDYWSEVRGLKPETIDMFQLGYDPLNDIGVIPLRDKHGDLIGLLRRYLEPDADPKYKETKGYKKSHHLFGSWLLRDHPTATVAITEGAIDTMKCWQADVPAVAQHGAFVSAEQIRIIREMGIGTVAMFYDNDDGGRKAVSWSLGYESHSIGKKTVKRYNPEHDLRKSFLVKRVMYGSSKNDPDELTADEVRECLADADYVL